MKKLGFNGYSDDTFGEYNIFKIDSDNCSNGKPIVFKVWTNGGEEIGDEGLYVYGWYNGKDMPNETPGCWMIGVQNLFDDMPLPNWKMYLTNGDCEYSPTLIIEAPDNVQIKLIK